MRRAVYAICFVILVCNLAMGSSEGKRNTPDNESSRTTTPKINEKMVCWFSFFALGFLEWFKLHLKILVSIVEAEEAWNHCTKEMEEKRDAIKDFDMYIPQASDDLTSALLAKQSMHKAIDILPPQVRDGVLDCLRKNGLIFYASDPEVSSSYLRSHPTEGALHYSLHVSKKVSGSRSPGKKGKKGKRKSLMTAIIAIVATAVATFVLVAVIFFCCLRKNNEPKEEKPLLHLNDYLSENSSQKSIKLVSLDNKELSTSSSCKIPASASASASAFASDTNLTTKQDDGALPKPPGSDATQRSASGDDADSAQKAKLKPFFWDKVKADSGQSMVWHEIRGGSFQFNEEMIETLFGYQAANNKNNEKKEKAAEPAVQYIQIIDARKAQNLSILLRALNVTTQEVVDALQEGYRLPGELLQTLKKMTPTQDEELKLRLFAGDINQLGPAERFLKTVVEIPFAFKRIDALMFMSTFPEEVASLKESFATLEVACTKLKNSRLFLKLLEAVLKTGNRMNDGTYRGGAHAFKLDTLLKLSDVKGTDGKTTLLHFVVQEIMRYEGIKCVRQQNSSQSQSLGSFKGVDFVEDNDQDNEDHYRSLGLEVVSGVTTELEDVRKASAIDADSLTSTVAKLEGGLRKTKEFLDSDMKETESETQFYLSMTCFVDAAESDIKILSEEEKRIMEHIKSAADYFHGQAGTKEGLRLFAIVRDFLTTLDKVCKEIRDTRAKQKAQQAKEAKKEGATVTENRPSSASEPPPPSPDIRKRLFPAMAGQRMNDSSSDEESFSP
ncbi:hypothetical protein Godav_006543 [Gossypium davidsonii]|uniref:Formin-like protein n=1 Tax=Gossypium davidsonii TaxID=34287 RepID=A0A7J8S5L2_GOSDV|nr:hypothetical protein [Gossypium davidsonii]